MSRVRNGALLYCLSTVKRAMPLLGEDLILLRMEVEEQRLYFTEESLMFAKGDKASRSHNHRVKSAPPLLHWIEIV